MTLTFLKNKWLWGYGVVLIGAVAPILAMMIGVLLAGLFGCDAGGLNEGSAPDCPGGDIVYMLFVSSWYVLVTLPLGALALVVLGLVHLTVWYRRRAERVE